MMNSDKQFCLPDQYRTAGIHDRQFNDLFHCLADDELANDAGRTVESGQSVET
jgi:hypothetical protein